MDDAAPIQELADRLVATAEEVCGSEVKRGQGAPRFQHFIAEHQGHKILVTIGPMKE